MAICGRRRADGASSGCVVKLWTRRHYRYRRSAILGPPCGLWALQWASVVELQTRRSYEAVPFVPKSPLRARERSRGGLWRLICVSGGDKIGPFTPEAHLLKRARLPALLLETWRKHSLERLFDVSERSTKI